MAGSENDNNVTQVYLLGKTHLANNQGQFYIRNDPIIFMAAGDRHTIIITESGRAFAFGDNSYGKLIMIDSSYFIEVNFRTTWSWTYEFC